MPEQAKVSPRAAFLIIGNEVLSGRTRDCNLPVLATALSQHGIRLAEVRVVRDDQAQIVAAVNELRANHTHLFTSGGIGPTHDDITTAAIAKAVGVVVYRHPKAEAELAQHYVASGRAATESRLRMANVPQGAELVRCEATPAPGFNIANIYVFAGVPKIFAAMVACVIPQLPAGPAYVSRTLTVRVGESEVATDLAQVQEQYPTLELGSYPQQDEQGYFVELVIAGADVSQIDAARTELGARLKKRNLDFAVS